MPLFGLKSTSNAPDIIRISVAILITTTVSCTNLALTSRRFTTAGWLYDSVSESRATVQLVVQILATLLALLQTYVVSSIIRFRTNIFLESNGLQLDTIKLFEALWVLRLDLELPLHYGLLACIYILLAQAPVAIWTASLTPVVTTANTDALQEIPIYVNYNEVASKGRNFSSAGNWTTVCRPDADCSRTDPTLIPNTGIFTYIPWKGMLL
jgi:hypothetical protein